MMKKRLLSLLLCAVLAAGFIPYAPKETKAASGDRIMVSMGDSYSSGEGVEPFYNEKLSAQDRSENKDFLAHRSKKSWSGQLVLNGDEMKNQKDKNWFFVASSGAETKHFNGKQKKEFDRDGVYNEERLDPQIKKLKDLKSQGKEIDYVTMTIGGNDVGFGDIITTSLLEGNGYLSPLILADKLNDTWKKFYGTNGETAKRDKIKDAYTDVRNAVGKDTHIIVAGYPKLVATISVKNNTFTAVESLLIADSVKRFNSELNSIITNDLKDDKNIHFVSVEKAFSGHEAYSLIPYINPLMPNQKYDLKGVSVKDPASAFSDYSMHPNKKGTKAYAECVQKLIKQLEGKRKKETTTRTTTKPKPAVDDWRRAYIAFLKKYMREAENPDICGFSLVYIDDDDIPELVVRDGDAHVSAAWVYTCVDSEVVELVGDLSGTFGGIDYAEREGLIFSNVTYHGYGTTTIYRVDSGSCEEVVSLFSNEAGVAAGMEEYKINDESVSKEEYEDACAEYDKYERSGSYENDMKLTSDSIESIKDF